MELSELKEQILRKTIKPLYVFTGEEVAIMDIYIQKIVSLKNAVTKRADSVVTIFSKLNNSSFLNKPVCYIIRDDKDYLTEEKAWPMMQNESVLGDNIVILVYTNLDKRSKFYKAHTDVLVEFEKLSDDLLSKYVRKELDLSAANCHILINACNNDYSRILLECDKLKHLMRATGLSADQALAQALSERLIYIEPKDAIFELVDSICRRKVRQSYDLFEDTKRVNEFPLAIINVLYNNIRQMLLVQGAGDSSDICNKTGLTAYQVKLAKEKGNQYDLAELAAALRIIRETERGIKNGTMDQDMAVDYILIQLL